jgi:hypothetical protein
MIRIEHDFFRDNESEELVLFYKYNSNLSVLYDRPTDNYYSSQLKLNNLYQNFNFSKRIKWDYETFFRLNIQHIGDKQKVLEKHHKHVQKYSIIIFLNDDFEGGELVFDNITIKPVKNMLVTFSKELGHHVKPVTRGDRYSLVGFSDFEIEIDKYANKIII